VDQIDVLTDGASAIYGSDAIAGVINFRLRRDFDGAETRIRYGNSTEGGGAQQQYDQLFGKSWLSGNALVSYEYNQTKALYANDRSFSQRLAAPNSLIPYQRRNSIFATLNQTISDRVSVFVDGLYADRSQTQYFTDIGFSQQAVVPVKQYTVSAGIDGRLFEDWTLKLTGTTANDNSDQRSTVDYTGFGIYSSANGFINRLSLGEALLSGTVLALPTGSVKLAVGSGYRKESYRFTVNELTDHEGDRAIRGAFAEAQIPLVSKTQGLPGISSLDLSMAVRYEHYSDFGSTTNPKIGLAYKPIANLTIRASWGTSFRAPSVEQAAGPDFLYLYSLPAPTPSGKTTLLESYGGNPNLGPETATTWTLNLEYRPEWLDGFTTSITPYSIHFRDRIVAPFNDPSVPLSNPVAYAPFFVSNPSAALLQQQFQNVTPSDFVNNTLAPYSPADVGYLLNAKYQNISRRIIQGVDLSLNYRRKIGRADLDTFFSGSYLRETDRFTPESPQVKMSGTIFNPSTFRMRAGGNWRLQAWSATAALNYTTGESNTTSPTQGWVSPWTTVDAQVAYSSQATGFFHGIDLRLSVQNLFDQKPPFLAYDSTTQFVGVGFDSTNASAVGRFINIEIVKRW
jgi:outer membrane receptor protein involved in Fe transport